MERRLASFCQGVLKLDQFEGHNGAGKDINLNGSQMGVPPRKIGGILYSGTRGLVQIFSRISDTEAMNSMRHV